MKKKAFKKSRLIFAVLLIVAALSFTFFAFSDPQFTAELQRALPPSAATSVTDTPCASSFSVHFIDVGNADSILVLCDGKAMLVDGGESSDSDIVYTYLKKHSVTELDYLVMTHPHKDHIGGIPGALHYATAKTVLSSFETTTGKAFEKISALLEEQSVSVTVPRAGDVYLLGSASIEVVGPVGEGSDINNTSLILRVEYGETSFLLTGDAEKSEISQSLNAGYYIGCDVYKVGHHGSADSVTDEILTKASPKYAVISCGKDNSYGHPTKDALKILKKADITVLRTDMQGDIVFYSDGKELTYITGRNSDIETNPSETDTNEFVLNTSSMKFHLPTCSKAININDKNKAYSTASRDELIAAGYSPCSICEP